MYKTALFTLVLGVSALSNMAYSNEYTCNEVAVPGMAKGTALSAWLLFDDGPGGLDNSRLTRQGTDLDPKGYEVVYGGDYGQPKIDVKVKITSEKGLPHSLACTDKQLLKCTDEQLRAAATPLIAKTEADHFDKSDLPKKWEIITDPASVFTNRGKRDEYSFEMSSGDYTLPVYVWTSAGKCRIRPQSVHLDWKNGDDG